MGATGSEKSAGRITNSIRHGKGRDAWLFLMLCVGRFTRQLLLRCSRSLFQTRFYLPHPWGRTSCIIHMDVGKASAPAHAPYLHPCRQCRYCIRPWMACSRATQEQLPRSKYLSMQSFAVNFYVLMVINVYFAVNATPLKQIPSQPYCMKFLMFWWPVPYGSFKTSSR